MTSEIKSKEGEAIEEGDTVQTKIRGGKREGEVEAVYDAEGDLVDGSDKNIEINMQNPPKVVFTDQHGHQVAHNPETLSKT